MKKKKVIFSIISVAVIFAIIFGISQVNNTKKVATVFDEMYYSFEQGVIFRTTRCDIDNLKVINPEPDQRLHARNYGTSQLNSKEGLLIGINYFKQDNLSLVLFVRFEDGNLPSTLCIPINYDIHSRELERAGLRIAVNRQYIDQIPEGTEYDSTGIYFTDGQFVADILNINGITAADIEAYQNYLLYDKVLPDWFDGNDGLTRFSMDDLGEFNVIDNTYEKLGENWEQ